MSEKYLSLNATLTEMVCVLGVDFRLPGQMKPEAGLPIWARGTWQEKVVADSVVEKKREREYWSKK